LFGGPEALVRRQPIASNSRESVKLFSLFAYQTEREVMSHAPQTKTASQFRCPNRVVPPANINGAIAPTSKLANGVLMPKSRADKSAQSTPIFMKEHSFWGKEI